MAEPAASPRPWRRLVLRRVILPGALVGVLALVVTNVYVLRTTAPDIVDGVEQAPARSTAIVLGNTVFPGGVLSRWLAERVEVSLELYRAGKVKRIIVSGAYHPEIDYDEPGAMSAWLQRRGVPGDAIVLDRRGHRTAATMASAAALGVREALICTDAYHLPRSLYFARHAGIRAIGVPSVEAKPVRLIRSVRAHTREWLARAEATVEVAVRGVKAD
jgi:SanA protein